MLPARREGTVGIFSRAPTDELLDGVPGFFWPISRAISYDRFDYAEQSGLGPGFDSAHEKRGGPTSHS